MTTGYDHIPRLDEDRWYWLWDSLAIRQVLTDTFADELARHPLPPLNQVDRQDPSMLLHLAYQHNAVAFYPSGKDSEKQESIRLARSLNEDIGSERGYYTLMDILSTAGYATYVLDRGQRTGVELYITPPPGRTVDAEFIRWLTATVREIWPLDLDVVAIRILSVSEDTLYVYGWRWGRAYSGWPEGL